MAEQDQIDRMLDSIDPAGNPGVTEGAPRAPQMSMEDEVDAMLDSIDPWVSGWGPPKGTQQAPESSALGAFTRAAERSVSRRIRNVTLTDQQYDGKRHSRAGSSVLWPF